jgi:AmmeMemoRadiSam system protein A
MISTKAEPTTVPVHVIELVPEAARSLLLDVARSAILLYLRAGRTLHVPTDDAVLLALRATFVTLRQRPTGALRGCCGESTARRPLIDSVAQMAIASAVDDPRFYPVSLAEVPKLTIEISALTPLHSIRPEEVEVGRHGLLLVVGSARGLLLPQVPTLYGWDRLAFLEALCEKAGAPTSAWRLPQAELYAFEAEKWGEDATAE